jgi:hypothetical protein
VVDLEAAADQGGFEITIPDWEQNRPPNRPTEDLTFELTHLERLIPPRLNRSTSFSYEEACNEFHSPRTTRQNRFLLAVVFRLLPDLAMQKRIGANP